MCKLRLQPVSKKKRLLEPPSTRSDNRNGMNKPPEEKKRSMSSKEFASMKPDVSWRKRGLRAGRV